MLAIHGKVLENVIRHLLVLGIYLCWINYSYDVVADVTLDFELSDHCEDHIFNWCENIVFYWFDELRYNLAYLCIE